MANSNSKPGASSGRAASPQYAVVTSEPSPPPARPVRTSPPREGSSVPRPLNTFDTRGWDIGRARHKCCGCSCCCSTRVAVLVVNAISILFSVGALQMAVAAYTSLRNARHYDYGDFGDAPASDDDFSMAFNQLLNGLSDAASDAGEKGESYLSFLIALHSFAIVVHALGIYGAKTYKVWPVGISLIVYVLKVVAQPNIISIVINGFFAYPHAVFIHEMKHGFWDHPSQEIVTADAIGVVETGVELT